MRNVFDQYAQPENRLTHALATCLDRDRQLLRRFLRQFANSVPSDLRNVEVLEQGLPGEPEPAEEEAGRRGLPDVWIHDGEGWCVLIESKVASPVALDQLRRHLATAGRRGFQTARLLVLGVRPPKRDLREPCRFVPWSHVYRWACSASGKSEWASTLADYMETAERRMTDDAYLKEGTLTEFNGIPFDDERPYAYSEAKRVIRLAMEALRRKKSLRREALADLDAPGRKAITGKQASGVWDFVPLVGAPDGRRFTAYPHFTFSIQTARAYAHLTIPHGVDLKLRRNLVALGQGGLRDLLEEVNQRLVPVVRGDPGAAPWLTMSQRHYPSRRAEPVHDARLEFDLRTAFEPRRAKSQVKLQGQWLDAALEAFLAKRSNLQLAVGGLFSYRRSRVIGSPKAIDLFAKSWVACRPLLDVALKGRA